MNILLILLFGVGAFLLRSDPIMWVGSNRLDTVNLGINGSLENIWIDVSTSTRGTPTESPINTGVAFSVKALEGWRFLTKSEHQDPFTQPPDSVLLYTNNAVIQTNAFEYRSYSIAGRLDSAVLVIGGYNYQVWYGFIPPQPVSTNFIASVLRGPSKTNLFLGITRKLETGERYLGWLELVRAQADAYAPFRFGRAALDFLPDRPIRVGQQPEFPKLQPEVTAESVRLSVPAAYRRYLGTWLLMERADSLDEPVTWEPVDFGGTNVVTLPADSASRFYRLRLGP